VRDTEFEESPLVVLKPVSGAFDLDQPVFVFIGPKLHEIGEAGAILFDITRDPLEPEL
jgi:hypothetical protein